MVRSLVRSARTALKLFAWLFAFCLAACSGGGGDSTPRASVATFHPDTTAVPVSGPDVASIAPLDRGVTATLKRWNVPGVAIAIARNGRLIVARGYGYADFEAKQLMQPDSMSRIGSEGSIASAISALRRDANGYTWAYITNSRSRDGSAFASELTAAITQALSPELGSTYDLYPQYLSPDLPPRVQ